MRYEPKVKVFKIVYACAVFYFLKRGIKACYKLDDNVRKVISSWEDGFTFRLKILPFSPAFALRKEGEKLYNVPKNGAADLEISFKHIEAAMPVLTAKQSVRDTYKYSSIVTNGDIAKTIDMVDVITIVETYLFPSILTGKLSDKPYEKRVRSARVYLKALLGI